MDVIDQFNGWVRSGLMVFIDPANTDESMMDRTSRRSPPPFPLPFPSLSQAVGRRGRQPSRAGMRGRDRQWHLYGSDGVAHRRLNGNYNRIYSQTRDGAHRRHRTVRILPSATRVDSGVNNICGGARSM